METGLLIGTRSLTTGEAYVGRAQIVRPGNLSGSSGQVPPLDQLLRVGRASHQRIHEQGRGIRRFRKPMLTEWLDQDEHLW
jgi:hypothetical protein